jgi:hypothetical protein
MKYIVGRDAGSNRVSSVAWTAAGMGFSEALGGGCVFLRVVSLLARPSYRRSEWRTRRRRVSRENSLGTVQKRFCEA